MLYEEAGTLPLVHFTSSQSLETKLIVPRHLLLLPFPTEFTLARNLRTFQAASTIAVVL